MREAQSFHIFLIISVCIRIIFKHINVKHFNHAPLTYASAMVTSECFTKYRPLVTSVLVIDANRNLEKLTIERQFFYSG